MNTEMVALTDFSYENVGVRILGTKIEPWFVAVDVLRALGIHTKNVSRMLERLDDDEKLVVKLTTKCDSSVVKLTTDPLVEGMSNLLTPDEDDSVFHGVTDDYRTGNPDVWLISEPGLYKIMLRARTPKAEAFTRFVTHEVLPSIRKRGYYKAPKPVVDKRPVRGRPPLALAEYFERQQKYTFANGEKCDITELRWISRELGMPLEQINDKRTGRMVEFVNEQMVARGIESIADIPRSAYINECEPDDTYTVIIDGVPVELVR